MDLNAVVDFKPLPFARLSRFAVPYLKNTGPRFLSMKTSKRSQQKHSAQLELPLMQSAGAFPAKTLATQEKVQDLLENEAASGLSSTGSSKKLNRKSQSSKTSQPFALADWTACSGHSLRSGMMQSGIVFPLAPLARLTKGTASGSWPTPTARDWKDTGPNVNYDKLRRKFRLAGFVNGPPNPPWVEWLMGFPIEWTDCEHSETRSSRKSQN